MCSQLLARLDTEHQVWIEETRQQIAIGIAELDRGEGVDGPTGMTGIFSNFRRHGKRSSTDASYDSLA